MKRWIVLLRGINVGGNNILPMKDLRSLLESACFTNVQTYIQSGNCVLDTDEIEPSRICTHISKAIEEAFGFRPRIIALSKADLNDAIEANPYYDDDPKSVHFFFLSKPAKNADLEALRQIKKPSESFMLTDSVFYLHAPEGIGRSKLAERVEKTLGVGVTTRNLRTVHKVAKLSG